jgi:RHS repeat-associated protein
MPLCSHGLNIHASRASGSWPPAKFDPTSFTTTFNATNLDGTLSATITGTTITHHIADLRGNTTLTTSSSLAQATTTSYTEYGTPQTPQTPTNAWHGAQQRTTSATTGLIHMGVRLYNSLTGLFLQQDPIHGGNPNTYTHPVDPINQQDLQGKFWEEMWNGLVTGAKSAAKATWRYYKQHKEEIEFYVGLVALGICAAATVGACAVAGGVSLAATAGRSYLQNVGKSKSELLIAMARDVGVAYVAGKVKGLYRSKDIAVLLGAGGVSKMELQTFLRSQAGIALRGSEFMWGSTIAVGNYTRGNRN